MPPTLSILPSPPACPGPACLPACACRGDYKKLPPELLDRCEVEPLRQEEPESTRQAKTASHVCCHLLLPLQLRSPQQHKPPGAVSCSLLPPLPPRRWIPDELSPSAFVRLGELQPVAVDSFDQRFDVWVITAALSEGCGGPELPEEIMV